MTIASTGNENKDNANLTLDQRITMAASIAMQMLPGVTQNGEAEALLADAIRGLHRSHGQAVEQFLTEAQRDTLYSGVIAVREHWQESHGDWISDACIEGYTGFKYLTDAELVSSAMCDSPCWQHMTTVEEKIAALELYLVPQVQQQILCDGFDLAEFLDEMEHFKERELCIANPELAPRMQAVWDGVTAYLEEHNLMPAELEIVDAPAP